MKTEPVRIAALVQTVIVAIVACVTAFGVNLSQGQVSAVLGGTTAVLALIVAAVVRGKVTPTG